MIVYGLEAFVVRKYDWHKPYLKKFAKYNITRGGGGGIDQL